MHAAGLFVPSFLLVAVAGLTGCDRGGSAKGEVGADSGARADAGGLTEDSCTIVAPTACPTPSPTYASVAAIIAQRCAGPCHSGVPDGPWPLTDYQHVADWADVVRDELLDCSMPPLDSGVAMTAAERLAILTWIRCDYPE